MPKFEIGGKEYDLILTFESIEEIDKRYDSPLEFVGYVMAGKLKAFTECVYLGLLHTKKGFGYKKIEEEVKTKFERGELDMSDVMKIGKEVVGESFFFKKTLDKLLNQDPKMKAQFDALTN